MLDAPIVEIAQTVVAPYPINWSAGTPNVYFMGATNTFVAIPPVGGSQPFTYKGGPRAVELYRETGEYFLAMAFQSGPFAHTNTAGWMPGGVLKYIPIDADMLGKTMAVTAVQGTGGLRVNFVL